MISFKQFLKEAEYNDWNHERSDEDIEKLHQEHSKHYKYLPSQKNPLGRYTTSSNSLNNYLWEKHKDKKMSDDDFEYRVGQMDDAIHENKTPHNFHVYSGVYHDPREKMNSEGILHHPAYLSTSLSHGMAALFAREVNIKHEKIDNPHYEELQKLNPELHIPKTMKKFSYDKHILKIKVPKGHSSAYLENFTENPGEYEHVLPRGLNLKHTGTDVIHEGDQFYSHRTFIHHMKIVK